MISNVIPYIMMDGNAKEAILFYQKVLGAELLNQQTFKEMPENPEFAIPEEAKERISHATLKIGESHLMFSDTFPGQSRTKGDQVTLCINSTDSSFSKKIFESLQQDGEVNMDLQETFFSPAYGIVTDKFGVCFQVYTEEKS
ncbi:VOC family protein [Marininema halotolerans]|uniref:PhnB protein n=1 Tax=Marininema halotolerans TaxID=1155944 RepID=A0A1I6R944_9BACL|nr:VOC family protein [Marininema halotolerans]SFS61058.1 PhnB protein [Marininema halotolerans]